MTAPEPVSDSAVRDRARGALVGLAVGDALGMPTQALSRAEIVRRYGSVRDLLPGPPDQPIAPGLPAGTVTDDTDQALLLARLLIDGGGRVEPTVFAAALEDWERDMIARGSVDLLGPSTRRALDRLRAGEDPRRSGRDGTTNGAAMRVAPVGIAFADPDRLLAAVVESALVTHHTGPGIAAAAAVAAAVSAGLAGAALPAVLDAAQAAATAGARHGHPVDGPDIAERLQWARQLVGGVPPADPAVRAVDPAVDRNGGVVGDEVPGRADTIIERVAGRIGTSVVAHESVVAAFALLAALGDDPRATLSAAASLGGDTDTIAAICGAVLGAQHGASGMPTDWAERVVAVNRLDLEPLVDGLLALRAAG